MPRLGPSNLLHSPICTRVHFWKHLQKHFVHTSQEKIPGQLKSCQAELPFLVHTVISTQPHLVNGDQSHVPPLRQEPGAWFLFKSGSCWGTCFKGGGLGHQKLLVLPV